ncbi:tRNA methyltransferase 10 homolog B isoform X2 [Gallus gallus]|uniref:tRNA methyltransferase 10 homolog B isoform X2 n=1 Tax=Gallus gallus TaxID=9031 RepID=UPI001EFFA935|nr:tRNA methyltransferase 10 homolog B isoform X2 [Gallus gallus]XP_046793249.1 tRNA methyltransferase 10 homolog B isoform X2 [Gallus gallus]
MAVLRRRRGAQLGAEQGGRAEPAPPRPAPRRRRWRAAARWRTPRRRRWKRPARRSRCCGSSRRGPARRRARGTSFGSGGAGSGCWRRGGGGGRRRGSGAERGDPRAEVGRRGVRGRGGPGRAGLPSALCPAGAARQRGRALAEERLLEARSAGPRLCVDLGVADRMTPKETSRLAAQIRRLYGANRRAERPFWLCLTELVPGSPIHRECLRMNDGFSGYLMETTQESYLDLFPLDAIVYLTPDSENVLEDVDPEKVYVLGGLVDESIHKNPRGSAWLQHQVETRTSEVKSGGLSEISTCTVSRLSAARPTSDVHAVDLRLHQCTQHGQQTGGAGGHYAEGKLWLNCHYRNRVGLLPRLECCI